MLARLEEQRRATALLVSKLDRLEYSAETVARTVAVLTEGVGLLPWIFRGASGISWASTWAPRSSVCPLAGAIRRWRRWTRGWPTRMRPPMP